jgi:hypothetical protein
LPADEFARFREWFLALDAEKWDQQFDNDLAAGRLDQLADELPTTRAAEIRYPSTTRARWTSQQSHSHLRVAFLGTF